MTNPPDFVRTERLSIRRWRVADAPLLKDAIDSSLDHLREWMPWAVAEPTPVEQLRERLAGFEGQFDNGEEWLFGIFNPDESAVIGGTGLHRRIGPTGLEIGYWIRASEVRRGYATEAAAAMTHVALTLPGIDHAEIRCDPANAISAAIPRRLGYSHLITLTEDAETPGGAPRDTMVWRMQANGPTV
jgi:RimJ/RimL family protein N-acetyltransferase